MSTADEYWRNPAEASGPFDPMQNARLDPSAFDPASFDSFFAMPRIFHSPAGMFGGGTTPYGDVGIADPRTSSFSYGNGGDYGSAFADQGPPSMFPGAGLPSPLGYNPDYSTAPDVQSQQNVQRPQTLHERRQSSHHSGSAFASTSSAPSASGAPAVASTSAPTYVPQGAVYAPYGSSLLSMAPHHLPDYKLPPSATPAPPPFSPTALGLPPYPTPGASTNFAGLYSSSGFDMLSVLARVASRPNPSLQIGPVDTSCSFLVVDARKWDLPIVFASETFTKLTGYTSEEIIGRNCRFLQSPDGLTKANEQRKYTDSHAAWHMKRHITAGKESQSSLINYRKGGTAFINLVTIIPITWDSESEIAYYVGFQVDLVDQPNAILDRMRDGTYVVNYSLLNQPVKSLAMSQSSGNSNNMALVENEAEFEFDGKMDWEEEEKPSTAKLIMGSNAAASTEEVLKKVLGVGYKSLLEGDDKAAWNKFILDQSTDFIHVLSLKGSILYSSPSVSRILEYQPNELVGKTIQGICHPSDVVPVMRELKDVGGGGKVSLLYRVQRKHSGYIWLEGEGKLHIEPGKGRKSVIIVGRPRDVLSLSWMDLRREGGIGEREFWAKLSTMGMILSATSAVAPVLGFTGQEMAGTSIFQMVKEDHSAQAIQRALAAAMKGTTSNVALKMKARKGFVDVVARFFARAEPGTQRVDAAAILVQINPTNSHERKLAAPQSRQAPEHPETEFATPEPSERSGSEEPSTAPFQSTYKQLTHPSSTTDNVFDELDTTRCTSWQYELHQLQILNKKLRDEKDYLVSVHGAPPASPFARPSPTRSNSETSSRGSSSRGRQCANCGKEQSLEWRAGPPTPQNPTGLKSLCNACGLRWAKSQKNPVLPAGGGKGKAQNRSDDSRSPTLFTPYDMSSSNSSAESSASPVNWR